MKILAIESSCDETAAAVVENGTHILSNIVASSAGMHAKYGGIVPEIAAREQAVCIIPTIEESLRASGQTLESIDAIAITVGPGLIGSLLVGVETAKTIAAVKKIPLIPVNHVLAHMYANFIRSDEHISSRVKPGDNNSIEFPAVSLVVSGGHTELFRMDSPEKLTWLGGTLDDAAGEAFDKTARLLGFENRGGPAIQEAAGTYHPGTDARTASRPESGTKNGVITDGVRLPRPMLDHDNELNFSFSGLKTAILREVQKLKREEQFTQAAISQLAHEVQESITDVLVKKSLRAIRACHARSMLLSGGVAANLRLRDKLRAAVLTLPSPASVFIPPVGLCTDNAVYIASYAFFRGEKADWNSVTAHPDLSVENI
jgi:N6-L-threonylcarbamoyladenine synthase